MLRWAITFFVIAIIAGILGFTDIASGTAAIAKFLFFIFIVLFLAAIIFGGVIFGKNNTDQMTLILMVIGL